MNFSVRKTKYPAPRAPAIGNPTSATNVKISLKNLPSINC